MNTTPTENTEKHLAYAALLLLPLAMALPCFLGFAWAEGDLVRQFFPWKELGRQALAAGRLPLWNPFVFCGMPLLGNFQSALANPLHLPFYFLDFAPALGCHLLLHFALSGLGFYALARALGLSSRPALLSALLWQCNAFLLARVEFMSALSAYAWTPWILWAAAIGARVRVTAFLVLMQALAGYPLELGYALAGSFLLVWGLGRGQAGRLALGWLLGLACGAFVLLPGLELIHLSSRLAGGTDGRIREFLSLGVMAKWFWPSAGLSWKTMFSFSLPALGLAFFARGRLAWWSLGLLILGLGLGFGAGAAWLPNRHPTLALVYASMGAALICGAGAEALGSKLKPWAFAALYALVLGQAGIQWAERGNLVGAELYRVADPATALAKKITPGARLLASPALQNELESFGGNRTEAWKRFGGWLQANTPALAGLKDANGYDPLAPAETVKILNAAAFPKFGQDPWLFDLMGVEALTDWDAKGGRFHMALSRRKAKPLRSFVLEAKSAPLLDLDQGFDAGSKDPKARRKLASLAARYPVKVIDESPESLELLLPAKHPAGWVFLNDTFYPGWRAWVDGEASPIHSSWGAFRAVQVGVNSREITMHYKPLSFYLGVIVSGVALFFLLMVF